MIINSAFAIVAALFGTALIPLPVLAQNKGTCSPTVKDHSKQKLHCGQFGHLVRPALISSSTVSSQDACTNNCLATSGQGKRVSFGYDQDTKECRLYSKSLVNQKWVDRNTPQGFTFYNRNCFTTKCPTCTPSQPTGDYVVNGDFECQFAPWGNSSASSTLMGELGKPSEGNFAYVLTPSADNIDPTSGSPQHALYQYLDIEVPGQYTLTFDAYFENTNDFFTVGFTGNDPIISAKPSTTGQFHTYTIPLTGYGDEKVLVFQCYPATPGATIAVDNVSVKTADPISCTAGVPTGNDLVYNGAFDCGFVGWRALTNYAIELFLSTPVSPTDYAYEMNVTSAYDTEGDESVRTTGLLQQDVTVPDGAHYVLSVDVLNQADGNSLYVHLVPGSDSTIPLANSPSFQTYTATFTGDGSTNDLIIWAQIASASQAILFDNISLTPVSG